MSNFWSDMVYSAITVLISYVFIIVLIGIVGEKTAPFMIMAWILADIALVKRKVEALSEGSSESADEEKDENNTISNKS